MIINVIGVILTNEDSITIISDTGERHTLNSKEYDLDALVQDVGENLKPGYHYILNTEEYSMVSAKPTYKSYLVPNKDIRIHTGEYFAGTDRDKLDEYVCVETENLSSITIPENHTLLAIREDDLIVPHADKLKAYMSPKQSKKGLKNFLKIFKTIKRRSEHTAQELLDFLENSELPLANDGSIIGYKILSKKDNTFVDCHTEKIKQNVGSIVKMSRNSVDSDRNISCSYGLHVASLSYLNSFLRYDNEIFFVKVNPKDVVSIPNYDTTKMRCCKYEIIGALNKKATELAKENKPISNDEKTAIQIKNILKGNYPSAKEIVTITNRGETLSIEPKSKKKKYKNTQSKAESLRNVTEDIIKAIQNYSDIVEKYKND